MLNAIYYLNPFRNAACTGVLRRASQAPCLLSQTELPRLNSIRGNTLSPITSSAYLSSGRRPEKLIERVLITPSTSFRSDSTYQNYARMGWLHLWTGVGGLLLGAAILKHEYGITQHAHCAERGSRAASVNYLRDNQPVVDPIKLGLKLDTKLSRRMSTTIEERKFYKTKTDSRFRAELVNGQLIWVSFEKVWLSDVQKIADFYKTLEEKRSLHINTGIHGSSVGKAAVDHNSGNFTVDDIVAFRDYEVSFHIVSSFSKPLTQKKLPKRDIMNAWCYSYETSDYSMSRGSSRGGRVKEDFTVPFSLKDAMDCFK